MMSLLRLSLVRSVRSINKSVYRDQFFRYSSQNTINLTDPSVQTYLKHLLVEHESIIAKTRRSNEDTQRIQEIQPIVNVLQQRIDLYDGIESLKDLNNRESKDEDMKAMIKEEARMYLHRIKEIDEDLQTILLQPSFSKGGILLEVTAGAGGQESMLFARELFDLYHSHSEQKGWNVDIASLEKSDIGGIRKGSLLIHGYGVPELMRMEAGVHRVQRIPETEKGSRMHTSTVSVAVLPQPTEIELDIPERDISIETKRASGAGGQHVNTTDSAVRIIHLPTGIAVECQEGKSQIKNREIALQKLRTLLLKKQEEEQSSKIRSERKSQVGGCNRNEKVRTYNYAQDRVTDHRASGCTTHGLSIFMAGGEQLEELQLLLLKQRRYDSLIAEINDFISKFKNETVNK